jgi:hypothetical protein
MLSSEDRKYILNQHLRNIASISDKNYQERIWIRGEGPEYDDFDETCCHFFDDGDPILENYKDYSISNDQYEILKKLRAKFDLFSEQNTWPAEFINTPEWTEITLMAKEVLKAFNYNKLN